MNSTLIKKCLDELAKDKPDLSYLRGILETLFELGIPPTEPTHLLTRGGMIKLNDNLDKVDEKVPESYVTSPGRLGRLE